MPELRAPERAALKADIAANGVRVPVVIDADTGEIVDGYTRVAIVEELRAEGVKVRDYPRHVVAFGSDDERVAFALAANVFRRHLTKSQRAELAVSLRGRGWSERRIAEALSVGASTVHRDLGTAPSGAVPERVVGKDGRSQPARRPPSLFVVNRRDAERARKALVALAPGTTPTNLLRAEERAREAHYAAHKRTAADLAARIAGPSYELRVGDLNVIWDDLEDGSIDAIVTDPPYNEEGIPLYEDLARLTARVLVPGRLAAVYCGHLHLDEEIRLLQEGGLSYVWHGVNVLPGRHTKVRARMVNGRHRSVVLMSSGPYAPRKWLQDTFFAQGRGGPEARPLHPWQQALAPVVHWVQMVSEPGELVMDPFCGSGTTGVAALATGRRFLGGDIEPSNVKTTRERLESNEVVEPA
jgi:site-specific DNA-methyltransferase (adenine-specific)